MVPDGGVTNGEGDGGAKGETNGEADTLGVAVSFKPNFI